MDTIKFGKYKVEVSFEGDEVYAAVKGGCGFFGKASRKDGAAGIAKAVREAVEIEATYEQTAVDRKRAIEDAKRLLGL